MLLLAFFLLLYDDRLVAWFKSTFPGIVKERDGLFVRYVAAVDDDFEKVFGIPLRVETSLEAEVESAFTEPVSVEGAENNVVDVVNMGLEDPLLRIQGSPRVRVTVKVQEVQQTRTFDDLPVELRGGGGLVRPTSVSVTVSGATSLLRDTLPSDIKPYVDLSAAQRGQEAPVAVELAAGHTALEVRTIAPDKVNVRVLRPARTSG